MEGALRRRPGAAGFTLVEVLVAVVIMSIVGVAIAAISLTGVVQISDDSQERQLDATAAQWTSMVFAKDVQGASEAVPSQCGTGDQIITLQSSDNPAHTIGYSATRNAEGTWDVERTECDNSVPTTDPRTVVRGLSKLPAATTTAERRIVSLKVDRTATFEFELAGARRTTDGNRTGVPADAPDFLSLGGTLPLSVTGNSRLRVIGSAYINLPPGVSSGKVVELSGSGTGPSDKQLSISGDFALQAGGTCPNCGSHSNKQPGSFTAMIPDPMRFLPAPVSTGLKKDCPVTLGVRVCEPGIYEDEFPPSIGGDAGVKDFRLEPGVYVLQAGMKVTNGSITGDGVLLYNESGEMNIRGADLDLEPMSSGMYQGILIFQARDNLAKLTINGNGTLASLVGTIYVPGSAGVALGGGNGELRVGRVVGASLEVFGNGTVIVDGSG